jgi:hypothetical protein
MAMSGRVSLSTLDRTLLRVHEPSAGPATQASQTEAG